MMSNGFFGIIPYFFAGNLTNSDSGSKTYHDSYEVFVNDDYVGNKVLINQSDEVRDIDGYLQGQGVAKFQSELDGGRYLIHAEDHSIAKRAKDVLNVYLSIR